MVRVRNNPHLRGVNYNVTKEEFMTDGSSPLAWGQHAAMLCGAGGERVIPIRVGSTSHNHRNQSGDPGHPHSRGVNTLLMKPCAACGGSSPLAWGQRRGRRGDLYPFRVIPTRVGSTAHRRERQVTKAGHLHSRGVNSGELPLNAIYPSLVVPNP